MAYLGFHALIDIDSKSVMTICISVVTVYRDNIVKMVGNLTYVDNTYIIRELIDVIFGCRQVPAVN